MITHDWRQQLKNAIRSLEDLACREGFEDLARSLMKEIPAGSAMFVTPYYLSLAQRFSADDPILRQCLPSKQEFEGRQGTPDPLNEHEYSPIAGVVHRYPDRVLVKVTTSCAVLCRHCFRKRVWRCSDEMASWQRLDRVLEYIASEPGVREVILSGGDPLLLDEALLDSLLQKLFRIATVEIVRIGSRLPVVLPQRLKPDFCERIGRHGPVWLATHFNHPFECTREASAACLHLLKAGIPVVNQCVLLKGVNDDSETIRRLGSELLKMRVKPYYLFHGDPAAGTMHFRTGLQKGMDIMRELIGHSSGLLVPRFAMDLPCGGGKVPMLPDYEKGSGEWMNFEGEIFTF